MGKTPQLYGSKTIYAAFCQTDFLLDFMPAFFITSENGLLEKARKDNGSVKKDV
jgi:hypothetical protein